MSPKTTPNFGKIHDGCIARHLSCEAGIQEIPEDQNTLAKLFNNSVKNFPDNKCFGWRPILLKETIKDPVTGRDLEKLTQGPYEWATYKQVSTRVNSFGKGLLEDGALAGGKIAIFMDTCMEWQIAAHACHQSNISVATMYATLGAEAVAYGINQTKVTHLVTEERLLPLLKDIVPECPDLKHIIFKGESDICFKDTTVECTHFSDIEKLGENSEKELIAPGPDDLAVIMYTSGSTGLPKGVMLKHKQVVSCAFGVKGIKEGLIRTSDRYIGYLPLAHILELVAETTLLSVGGSIGYGNPQTLSDASPKVKKDTHGDAPTLKPTLMAAVPAIMDRIRKGVSDKIAKESWLKQMLFNKAYSDRKHAYSHGQDTPIWNWLVFSKARAMLGGELRFVLSGGAPLAKETQEFMNIVFGVPVLQGYGLTETSGAATICDPTDRSYGRVGAPITTMEIKLKDWEEGGYLVADKENKEIGMSRGEILIAGANLASGYYNNEEKTKEDFVADDSGKIWFHTGDIGQLHADGCLQIIDRKKDLVKLQMGEYVSLGKVEAALKGSDFVDNVCVFASSFEKYCIAVVVPNQKKLTDFASENGITFSDWKELCSNEKINKAVVDDIQKAGKAVKLQRFETPTKVHVTDLEWTPETDLVTAALKLKRNNINKHYQTQFDEMYGK